jgi:UDP-glucuronate 4-epimerase
MRVVITGCAGFIGSHLAERMLAEGWRVTGVDAFTPYYPAADKEANLASVAADPRFDLVRADVATTALGTVFAGRPVVVHLAAQPGVRGSFGDGFERYLHDNLRGTQRLFEAARDTGCPRVVYASSSSVYGDAPAYPCSEDTTATRPRSPYGVTKLACESLADVYRGSGLDVVGMRYFTVYGPRQRPDMALRRLCEAGFGGAPFVLHGDGSAVRDFTHVADAVDATLRAVTAPDPGTVLNVGGGVEASMAAVIGTIEDLLGRPLPIRRGPEQPGDVRRTGADTAAARARLEWSPRVPLRAGIASELDWVRERHPAPARVPALAGSSR